MLLGLGAQFHMAQKDVHWLMKVDIQPPKW